MDRFRQILYDLGKELHIDLFLDQHEICELNYNNVLHIQIHYDESKERVLLASFVSDIPPGKYREKLFESALISNNEYPRVGTLAYSERNNKLTLFEFVSAIELTGEKLFKILQSFIQKALLWKDAIETGKPLPSGSKSGPKQGIFGLKP